MQSIRLFSSLYLRDCRLPHPRAFGQLRLRPAPKIPANLLKYTPDFMPRACKKWDVVIQQNLQRPDTAYYK